MDHTLFMPHGVCLLWKPALVSLLVVTDLLIALAYYSIPLSLLGIAIRGRRLPARPMLVLFGLFILFCGTGHVIDAVSIWKPIYWTKGFWNIGTAATSVVTAIILMPKAYHFISMPEAHEKLQADYRLLNQVVSAAQEGILLVDHSGRMRVANPAALRLLCLEEAPADPQSRPPVPTPPSVIDWLNQESQPGEVLIAPCGDPAIKTRVRIEGEGDVYTLRDGSVRVENERRIREQCREIEFTYSKAPVGLGLLDSEGRVVRMNQQLAQYCVPEGSDPAGKLLTDAMPQIAEVLARHENQVGIGESSANIDIAVPVAGEDSRILMTSFHPINGSEAGANTFMVALDVTEIRKAERKQQEIEENMVQTQKLESLGLLAGGIAHDFNNILAAMLGYVSLAMTPSNATERVHEYLAHVESAINQAAQLTRQMLAYSGRSHVTRETIHIGRLVQEISGLLDVSISKKIGLHLELPPDLPPIRGDIAQLRQVMLNLVINASEAIGDNPGHIRIAACALDADRELLSSIRNPEMLDPGRYVQISVSDSGTGMDAKTVAKIFDPFFTTKFTGRGLGLASVLGIVRGHKGGIKVISTPGHGTTFQLLFPAAPLSPEAPSGTAARWTDWRGSGGVLIADDEPALRQVVGATLSACGIRVFESVDGVHAVEVFEEHADSINLAVLDVTMPRMDGVEALRRLRQINPELPVVLMTGYSKYDVEGRIGEFSIDGLLEKPFPPAELIGAVRSVMERQVDPERPPAVADV